MKKLFVLGMLAMTTLSAQKNFKLSSSDFSYGKMLPKDCTQEGTSRPPHLKWSGAPKGTVSFALICDDPDAPQKEPVVHWLVYNISKNAQNLDFLQEPQTKHSYTALQGQNSYKRNGYDGPMPPKGNGIHHYHFKLYALNCMLTLQQGASKNDLLEAMQAHILAQIELVGIYERK